MIVIRKCFFCNMYTFKENCPKCGKKTRNPHPPKFSPEDKYGHYRRMAKKYNNKIDTISLQEVKEVKK